MTSPVASETVFILGISSDIGKSLAERYLRRGSTVVGTYRNPQNVVDLADGPRRHLLSCDVADKASVVALTRYYHTLGLQWSTFISCVGTEEPIGNFFACDFDAWEQSVIVNSMAQLRVLHTLYPFRRQGQVSHVVFFAGGGTNNPFTNYSAYCASKILLIKMCELLDDENKDLNVFVIGPGWVRTKIHKQTLDHPAGARQNYQRTIEFLRSEAPGTSYDDIYDCINWCIAQGRDVAGGRNFSVVHDPWRQGGEPLAEQLRGDPDMFKLRRFGNKKQGIESAAHRHDTEQRDDV